MWDSESNPFSVLASLSAGPEERVRVSYRFPHGEALARLFRRPRQGAGRRRHASAVLEIDRAKLRSLRFSQQELAEIGFSLVMHLAVLDRYRTPFEKDSRAA